MGNLKVDNPSFHICLRETDSKSRHTNVVTLGRNHSVVTSAISASDNEAMFEPTRPSTIK